MDYPPPIGRGKNQSWGAKNWAIKRMKVPNSAQLPATTKVKRRRV